MIRLLSLLIFIFSPLMTEASDSIVSGLSSKNVSINTTFTGKDILLFGSIKRNKTEKIIPSNIIIEVLGPKTDLILLKKKKVFGIWVNSNPIKVHDSPSFYSLLYTKKPESILSEVEIKKASIGKEKFIKPNEFNQALRDAINAKIRIKIKEGSYIFNNRLIKLKDETLFSTQISLPANLTEGDYTTTIYLVQEGKVLNSWSDILKVRKVGVEKWLYNTAHENPLFYGVFSIFLALFFGWTASSLFRKFQK